jgi:hypothetical protein
MGSKHFGTTKECATALGRMISEGLPAKHLDLLQAHCEAPRRTRTASQLAEAVGYANGNAVNLQYGSLAHRVATELGVAEPPGLWLFSLVDWAGSFDAKGHTGFVLRKPVAEALSRLGYPWASGVRQHHDGSHDISPRLCGRTPGRLRRA